MFSVKKVLNVNKPLIITAKNCDFLTINTITYEVARDETTGDFIRDEKGQLQITEGIPKDIPTFLFRTPNEFQLATEYPKQVTIDNISIYDRNGNECWGYSCHINFQRELEWLDKSVGSMVREFKPKTWYVNKEFTQQFKIWFRDSKWNYFTPDSFIITGYFHYSDH